MSTNHRLDFERGTITTTNRKSCTLDSFAYVTGLSPEFLAKRLGHDGSSRGVSIHEMTTVLLPLNWAVVTIYREPSAITPDGGLVYPYSSAEEEARWTLFTKEYCGVVQGLKNGRYHSMAMIDGVLYDPANPTGRNAMSWEAKTFHAVIPV